MQSNNPATLHKIVKKKPLITKLLTIYPYVTWENKRTYVFFQQFYKLHKLYKFDCYETFL